MKKTLILSLICLGLASSASYADSRACQLSIYPKGKPARKIEKAVELGETMQVVAVGPNYCAELQMGKTDSSFGKFSGMDNFYLSITDGQPKEETIDGQKETRCVFSNRGMAQAHSFVDSAGPIFIEIQGIESKGLFSKPGADLYVLDCTPNH
ncbi:MAG: hypothetical protein HYW49_11805 [Deltaproteobacteria bacterium]|nr:hypothetical protein [Deltaproteobacteria bacterium]